jgi:IMP dehydrogenase/GMP reductase
MRIIDDIKLDFKDVLFVPHRSSLGSRNEVDLQKKYILRNSKQEYHGVPIVAANMDGVGTPKMALALAEFSMMTCLTKHYSVEELIKVFNYVKYRNMYDSFVYSLGTSEEDQLKYKEFKRQGGYTKWLCLDVANGYSQKFVDLVKTLRDENPDIAIIAGNVVTPDITEALLFAGADVIKVGIGPGCFTADSMVLTGDGFKRIVDIELDDMVLTHQNRFRKILHKFEFKNRDTLLKINNIKCTPNHEFYVVNKLDRESLTDDNIHNYGYWVSADKLDKDTHLLLKSTTRS